MSAERVTAGRIALRVVLVAVLAGVLYLGLWPVPIRPVAWTPPRDPGFVSGTFAATTELAAPTRIAPDVEGPEALAFAADGSVVAGLLDGRIVRVAADGAVTTLADTGGRPLGMVYAPDGTLYVADAHRGLLSVSPSGAVAVLVDTYEGRRMLFVDDVDRLPDGRLVFTDASEHYGLDRYKLDLLEHRPSGRVFVFDPRTRTTTRLASRLHFANGIAVSKDGSYAVVCETGIYRLRRIDLVGRAAGHVTTLVDGLPGFCDNVRRDPDRDVFWVALPSPRDPLLDFASPYPRIREAVVRLPAALQPGPKSVTRFIAVYPDGGVAVAATDDSSAAYGPVTTVVPHGGHLYLGSLSARGIARIDAVPPLIGGDGRTEGN